jgi:hypothetical protein
MITKRINKSLTDEAFGDLIEFEAISGGNMGFDMMNLQRNLDIEISEDDDDSINSDVAEIAFNHVNTILQTRIERVGEKNYPFGFSIKENRFFLKSDISDSGYIYLFCLFLSHPHEDDVLSGIYLPNISDSERRLFQSCSTVAAAGLITGNAISFGFPRIDKSGFYDKLKQVYGWIGDGKVRKNIIPGTPKNIKDFEIDIIAWLHRQDAQVLERYFLAQVASGLNWMEKTLSSDKVNEFHDLFFIDQPKNKPERGIFVPFVLEYESDISLEDKLRIFVKRYGGFQYRFSIPRHYANGCELSQQNGNFIIDGMSDFDDIKSWVFTEIIQIRGMMLR